MSETQKYRLRELYGRLHAAEKEIGELRAENDRLRVELMAAASLPPFFDHVRYVRSGHDEELRKEILDLRAENGRLRAQISVLEKQDPMIIETSSQIRYVTPEEIMKTAVTERD